MAQQVRCQIISGIFNKEERLLSNSINENIINDTSSVVIGANNKIKSTTEIVVNLPNFTVSVP